MALAKAEKVVLQRPGAFAITTDLSLKSKLRVLTPLSGDRWAQYEVMNHGLAWRTHHVANISAGVAYKSHVLTVNEHRSMVSIGGGTTTDDDYTSGDCQFAYWGINASGRWLTVTLDADYKSLSITLWRFDGDGTASIAKTGDATLLRSTVSNPTALSHGSSNAMEDSQKKYVAIAEDLSAGDTITFTWASGKPAISSVILTTETPTDPDTADMESQILTPEMWPDGYGPSHALGGLNYLSRQITVNPGSTMCLQFSDGTSFDWGSPAHTTDGGSDDLREVGGAAADQPVSVWTITNEDWSISEIDINSRDSSEDVSIGGSIAARRVNCYVVADAYMHSLVAPRAKYEEWHEWTPAGYTMQWRITINAAGEAANLVFRGEAALSYPTMLSLNTDDELYLESINGGIETTGGTVQDSPLMLGNTDDAQYWAWGSGLRAWHTGTPEHELLWLPLPGGAFNPMRTLIIDHDETPARTKLYHQVLNYPAGSELDLPEGFVLGGGARYIVKDRELGAAAVRGRLLTGGGM